jgi:MinD-like ATPase involved in chromosome partitioning or flagellar assembly
MGHVFALVSGGGSPGVTTAAIALALTWPTEAIVAECDPGGGDILAGLLAGHVPAARGLMEHAIEAGRDRQSAAIGLGTQLVPLDRAPDKKLLPGLTDPRQAVGLAPAWPAVAASLAAQRADVIADCGRIDAGAGQPTAVIEKAHIVALVLRPTLRQVWSARSRVEILTRLLDGTDRLVLMLTGPGTHTARDVAQALQVRVAAVLPKDVRTAALLSDGTGAHRRIRTAPLVRSAKVAGAALRRHAGASSPAGSAALTQASTALNRNSGVLGSSFIKPM